MKNSLIIIVFFLLGVVTGKAGLLPDSLPLGTSLEWTLLLLMLFIGLSFGSDPKLRDIIRSVNPRLLIVPLTTIAGTFLGIAIYNLLFSQLQPRDAFAVGAGFGYYSLSGILISEFSGEKMGIIALLANVTREIITLLFAPLIVRVFGKTAAVSSGGATSMDTTLPVILKSSGKDYLIISLFHGIVLTILVPFIITLLYRGF